MYARDVLDAQAARVRGVLADEPLEAVLDADDVEAGVDGLDGGGRDDRVDAGRGPAAHDYRQNLFVRHAEKPSPLPLVKAGFYRSGRVKQTGDARRGTKTCRTDELSGSKNGLP